jgi:hypothetical protein
MTRTRQTWRLLGARLGTGCLPWRGCVRNSSQPRPLNTPGRPYHRFGGLRAATESGPLAEVLVKAGANCRPPGGSTVPIIWPPPRLFYARSGFSICITRTIPYSFKWVVGTALAERPGTRWCHAGRPIRQPLGLPGLARVSVESGSSGMMRLRGFRARPRGVGGSRTDAVPGHAAVPGEAR